jgi:hypothetical protein
MLTLPSGSRSSHFSLVSCTLVPVFHSIPFASMVERLYVSPVPLLETMVSVPFLEVKNPENDSFGVGLV